MTKCPEQDFALEFHDDFHFVTRRKIAEGGMGLVYEGTLFGSDGFEKIITVKTIREDLTGDRDFVDMFIGEAKLVADLVHQNIVQIYKLGKLGNQYYIAMEYVNGINLKEFMKRHEKLGINVPIDMAAFIISRVCRGLEYAHRKKDPKGRPLRVVHRDISPKNLMLSTEGEVKITDFGIAKARNVMKNLEGEILLGRVHYMSPEQAQFLKTDRRSDLFSLGIVMYELLTGESLFGTSDVTKIILRDVINREITAPREIHAEIPEHLERIVLKALTRDLDRRYQDAGEMAYDLEYFMYHKGYGPTIVTLEKYIRELFPRLYHTPGEETSPSVQPAPTEKIATTKLQRARGGAE
ncbi:serine/threonine protein kinase [Acidobacteriota bacterium]